MAQAPLFERMLVDSGISLTKFWFSVTQAEQRTRFIIRQVDPVRQWKLSPIDLESLDKWDDYTEAKEAMIRRTDTEWAPWTTVKSNDKKRARINAMRAFLSGFDYDGKDTDVVGAAGPPDRAARHRRRRRLTQPAPRRRRSSGRYAADEIVVSTLGTHCPAGCGVTCPRACERQQASRSTHVMAEGMSRFDSRRPPTSRRPVLRRGRAAASSTAHTRRTRSLQQVRLATGEPPTVSGPRARRRAPINTAPAASAEASSHPSQCASARLMRTVPSTDPLAEQADALQYGLRDGPCYYPLVNDLAAAVACPRYGPKAAALGLGAQAAVQLFHKRERAGVNLYALRPQAFDHFTMQVADLFANLRVPDFPTARIRTQLSEGP